MSVSGMARDNSIVALTGSSQAALPLNGARQFLIVENTGTANIGVNFSGIGPGGGAAVIGGTGTVTLAPGGSLIFDHWCPQNAVNVTGTTGQSVCVIEG
jgi:hypothetical protein